MIPVVMALTPNHHHCQVPRPCLGSLKKQLAVERCECLALLQWTTNTISLTLIVKRDHISRSYWYIFFYLINATHFWHISSFTGLTARVCDSWEHAIWRPLPGLSIPMCRLAQQLWREQRWLVPHMMELDVRRFSLLSATCFDGACAGYGLWMPKANSFIGMSPWLTFNTIFVLDAHLDIRSVSEASAWSRLSARHWIQQQSRGD